jgi:hypothetical protein
MAQSTLSDFRSNVEFLVVMFLVALFAHLATSDAGCAIIQRRPKLGFRFYTHIKVEDSIYSSLGRCVSELASSGSSLVSSPL